MGREVLRVQHAEVLRHFLIFAHGVGHARPGVHAGERRSDDRQEHREGLDEHEDPPVSGAEQRRADHDHHVADRRRRGGGIRHTIPAVEEVICREVLKQVADQALDQQRRDHRDRNVAFRVLGLAPHRGHRLESHQDQDGHGGLNENPAPIVRAHDRSAARMAQEVALVVGRRIGDVEGHGLPGGIQLGLGPSVGLAQNRFRSLPVRHRLFGREFVGVCFARCRIVLVGHAARRMTHPKAEGQNRKHHQRRDLDHVDGDIDRRRAGYATMGDIGHEERERHRNRRHEHRAGIGRAHEARPNGPRQVAAQDSHYGDHHSRVDPVVEVGRPTDDELRKPRVAPDVIVVQERLFREVIRTAGARIQLGHFRIAQGGRQAQQEGHEDSHPHGRSADARGRLDGKSQPQKGSRCDERHGVHRQAGQAQSWFHLDRGGVGHTLLLLSFGLFDRRGSPSLRRGGPALLIQ